MSGALEKNQRLTLSCARLGSELEGVCSHEGMAVFVPGVLPGETAEVQIVKALPNYAFGRLVQVLEPSAQRRSRVARCTTNAAAAAASI